MKLGMPTLVELDSLEQNIELCQKLQLNFIEINMDLPYCFPNRINWEEIKKYKDIELTVHLSEILDIGNINEDVRKQQINLIKEQILFLKKKAAIKRYNLHLNKGVYFTLPNKNIYIYEKYEKEYLDSIRKSFKELSEFAVEQEVCICLENTTITSNIKKAFKEVINYSNIYYTLDVGHDMKNAEQASRIFMENPSKIKHLHIHDFDGKADHLELGTGKIDIKKYLSFCKENNCYGVIEIKRREELEKSINYIKTVYPF